jgi:mannose-6-phosphate isomerase-like protein (cupin superfamily)
VGFALAAYAISKTDRAIKTNLSSRVDAICPVSDNPNQHQNNKSRGASGMLSYRNIASCFALLLITASAAQAQADKPAPLLAWAPQPTRPAPFQAPNKPLKKLSDILARHARKTDWAETEVLTRDFIGQYVSMGPGKKTKTQFYADDRVFWVVESGQIRFTIDGQEPFVATKGFLVQVPYRIPYSMETVGDAPSLRFEVRPAGETPSYPVTETPAPVAGITFAQASYTGRGKYDDVNKPYSDFEKDIVAANRKGGAFVKDDHTWANVIRSPGIPTPPDSNYGHFHENFAEFWIVMEGKLDFLIQGVPGFTANVGDIVFAPEERWHRATSARTGMATRLAITPRPPSLHYYQPGHAGGE